MNQQPDASRLAGGEEQSRYVYLTWPASPLPCLVEIDVAVYYCITEPPPLCFWICSALSSHGLDSSCHEKYHNISSSSGYHNFATEQKHRSRVNDLLTKRKLDKSTDPNSVYYRHSHIFTHYMQFTSDSAINIQRKLKAKYIQKKNLI